MEKSDADNKFLYKNDTQEKASEMSPESWQYVADILLMRMIPSIIFILAFGLRFRAISQVGSGRSSRI